MKKLSSKLFFFFLIFGSFFTPIYSEEWSKERDAKITTKIDVETFWKQVKKLEQSNMEKIQLGIPILIIAATGRTKLPFQKEKDMSCRT